MRVALAPVRSAIKALKAALAARISLVMVIYSAMGGPVNLPHAYKEALAVPANQTAAVTMG